MEYGKKKTKSINMVLFALTVLVVFNTNTYIQKSYSVIGFAVIFAVFTLLTLFNSGKRMFRNGKLNILLITSIAIYVLLLTLKGLSSQIALFSVTLAYIYLCWSAGEYLINNYDKETLRKFIIVNIVILLVSQVLGINVLNQYPYASRDLAGAATKITINFYKSLGAAGFGFVYGNVMCLIGIVYAFRNSKQKFQKFILVLSAIASIVLIVKASFSIAIISTGLILILTLGYYNKRKNKQLYMLLLAIVFILIFVMRESLLRHLISFGEAINSQAFTLHMKELLIAVQNESFSTELARFPIWERAVNEFLKSPLYGGKWSGGHSFILKHLALFGLCAVPALSMTFYIFKQWKKYIPRGICNITIAIFIFITLLNSYASVETQTFVFLLLPCMLYAWSAEGSKCNENLMVY